MLFLFKGAMRLLSRACFAALWFVSSFIVLKLDAQAGNYVVQLQQTYFLGHIHGQIITVGLVMVAAISCMLQGYPEEDTSKMCLRRMICGLFQLAGHGLWFTFLAFCRIEANGDALAVAIPDITMLSFFAIAGCFLIAWTFKPRTIYFDPRHRKIAQQEKTDGAPAPAAAQ